MTSPDQHADAAGGGSGLQPGVQPANPPGQDSAARSAGRYQLGDELAPGLRAVRDRSLDRNAVARLADPGQADDLEREARFLARLDHPGSPDVFDFVRGDGGAMLVTRRVEGITLAEAVALARAGNPPPELASPAAVVQMAIRLCEIVAAAHDQGIVHHGLAPAGVLLGRHGQVVVVDWTAAMAEKRSPATLRYLPGTTARSERLLLDGLHADVRAIGAILGECLLLRVPAPTATDALGPVTPDERRRLPPGLEAVVRRALASDPSGGYRGPVHLAADLARYLDGLGPEAYVPGVGARLGAWLGRHGRALLATAAVLAAVVVAGWAVIGRQLHDLARWRTLASEDFAGPGWKQRWVEPPTRQGMFAVQGGRLVSTAERDAFLIFRQRLTTPAAIEYTGQILPGSQPCDLSVQWSETDGVGDAPARFAQDGRSYMIQAGAFGNAMCAIFVNPGRRLLAHANRQLETGRDYRFRVELDGTRITMAIDGETVLSCEEEIPTRSGFISLYGFYPGKAFSAVRVEEGGPANGPTPYDAADAAFLDRRWSAAAGLYARIAEAAGASAVGQRALYRKGLAEWSGGDSAAAGRTWSQVSDPDLASRIACIRLEEVLDTGRMTPHQSAFEERYRSQPAMREELRQAWRMILQQQLDAGEPDHVIVDYFLGLRASLFPEDGASRYVAAVTLLACHRYEEILKDFPDQRMACARSLLALGRSQQILDTPWVGNDEHNHALGMRGDFAGMLQMPGLMPAWRARALIRCGRAAEAARDPEVAYPTLLFLGRAGELLEQEHVSGMVANEALVCLGRLREAAGDGLPKVPGSGSSITAMLMLGQIDLAERVSGRPRPAIRFMQAAEAGDDQAYARLHDQVVLPVDLAGNAGWFAPLVMRPVVDALHGDPAALDRDLRPRLDLLSGIYARSGWYVARAVLGEIPPEGVLEMPAVPERVAWRAVAAGIRAELIGHQAEAREAYAAFAALPIHQRLLNLTQPDSDVEWFVAWRLRALAKAGP